MSVSDAHVEVTCDRCHAIEVVQLTATARGWDERNIADYLKDIGWTVAGDLHYCDECQRQYPDK